MAQILEKILGISVSVSALERINRAMAETVEPYWEATPPVPAPDGRFLVASADGKGVPIRKPPTTAPRPIDDPQAGPQPDRKKMAIVRAVYDAQPYVRTPEQVGRALFQFTPFRIQRETERLYPERKAHETLAWPWPEVA